MSELQAVPVVHHEYGTGWKQLTQTTGQAWYVYYNEDTKTMKRTFLNCSASQRTTSFHGKDMQKTKEKIKVFFSSSRS